MLLKLTAPLLLVRAAADPARYDTHAGLVKPFDGDALVAAVRELTDAGRYA